MLTIKAYNQDTEDRSQMEVIRIGPIVLEASCTTTIGNCMWICHEVKALTGRYSPRWREGLIEVTHVELHSINNAGNCEKEHSFWKEDRVCSVSNRQMLIGIPRDRDPDWVRCQYRVNGKHEFGLSKEDRGAKCERPSILLMPVSVVW